MSNVVNLHCVTKLDMPPDRILEEAIGKLDSVVIVGFNKDGSEFFATSYADGGAVLWLIERSKLKLLRLADPE